MIKRKQREQSQKPKKIPKAKRIKLEKKKADQIWSLKVRERDGGVCQIRGCGKKPAFAHHIFSRRHMATRWDLENGFTICWGHHRKGHTDHEWLRDEIISKIGQETFDRVKEKSKNIHRGLTELIEFLNKYQEENQINHDGGNYE